MGWKEVAPNNKRGNDRAEFRMLPSGRISLNEAGFHFLGEPKRVRLFFDRDVRAIAIKSGDKKNDKKKGWPVRVVSSSGRRNCYVNAQMFFRECGIQVAERTRIQCELERDEEQLVARLEKFVDKNPEDLQVAQEGAGQVDLRELDPEEIASLILAVVPVKGSGKPLSVPEIAARTRQKAPIRGRWSRGKKRMWYRRVRHQVKKLGVEPNRKLLEDVSKRTAYKTGRGSVCFFVKAPDQEIVKVPGALRS